MSGVDTSAKPRSRPSLTWQAAQASAKGSAHSADVPNQDAVLVVPVTASGAAPAYVAAVSDGHGGDRYVRSDRGSQLAVELAVRHLSAAVQAAPRASLEAVLREKVPAIVDAWRTAVQQEAAAEPFTAAEARRGGDRLAEDPVLAYGATLLLAVVRDSEVAIAQIGDGDAFIRRQGQRNYRPVPGDERLTGGETTSLCLPTAVEDFRFATIPAGDPIELVVLASDGYGNSFADIDWWPPVLDDLAGYLAEHNVATLNRELPTWLAESAQIGGDDVTVAVLARSPSRPAPPAQPPQLRDHPPLTRPMPADEPERRLAVAPGTRVETPPSHRRPKAGKRLRVLLILVAALVVAAGLAAVGLLLLRPDDSPSAPAQDGKTATHGASVVQLPPASSAPSTSATERPTSNGSALVPSSSASTAPATGSIPDSAGAASPVGPAVSQGGPNG